MAAGCHLVLVFGLEIFAAIRHSRHVVLSLDIMTYQAADGRERRYHYHRTLKTTVMWSGRPIGLFNASFIE